jgi:hypothetical protein
MLAVRKTWMAVLALTLAAVWTASASAAPLLGVKGAGDDADKWLLNDPEVVMTINVKQLLGSEIMKANMPALKGMLEHDEKAKAVLQATGLDPFKDLDSILISGAGTTSKDARALIVVRGTFDKEKIHEALKKEADKKGDVELVKEGDHQLYQFKAKDQHLYGGFASKSVLVVTHSKEATAEAMSNGGKKESKITPEMKKALGTFTGKESMTFAMVVNDELKKQIENAPQVGKAASKLQTLTASLTVTDSISLNVTGNSSEAKAAKQLANALTILKGAAGLAAEDFPPIAGKILEEIKITAEKESVVVALKITKAMIDEAAKLGGGGADK